MRTDSKGRALPPCLYERRGKYYFVKNNQWHPLGPDYERAMTEYARKQAPSGGMVDLIERVFQKYEKKHKDGKLAANTLSQYRVCRSRIEHAFLEFSPSHVKGTHIASFLDDYEDTPNMTNRTLTVLREIFRRAVRWGEADSNPCYGIDRFEEAKRTRYLTDKEYRTIQDNANPYIKCVMDICYLTAQRIGDVIAIKHSDISGKGIAFRQKKTDKRLVVEMTPELDGVVKAAKDLHPVAQFNPYLFHPRGKPTPYSYKAVYDCFKRAVSKAGVKDAKIHDLRAKSITDAKREGKDPQKLAGHVSRAMTERYIRLRETDVVQGPKLRHLKRWY